LDSLISEKTHKDSLKASKNSVATYNEEKAINAAIAASLKSSQPRPSPSSASFGINDQEQLELALAMSKVEVSMPTSSTSSRPNLVVSAMNQYQASKGGDASLCTSCAAAFLRLLKEGRPLTATTVDESLEKGQEAHSAAAKKLHRGANANLNAKDVIVHGGLGLQEKGRSISNRPTKANLVSQHYQQVLVPALQDQNRRTGALTTAILTKAPYSLAVAHRNGQFIVFDSHGESATNNRAFIRSFNDPKTFCDYLANRFGFDAEFGDIDYDVETGRDNPNCYELTFV
jgi:hypothetical protein